MLHAVVMAGGSGTRFWPLSRRTRPKHLIALTARATLLQQTVERIAPLAAPERTWIITGSDHADDLRRQLPDLPGSSIIAEPCRRDTAPCIGLAATLVRQHDPAATLVVMPADHAIDSPDQFRACVAAAANLVAEDPRRLVTFGVPADRPATGYGYIQRGDPVPGPAIPAFAVRRFVEKPRREVAERLVREGDHYWNSGIFVWSAATILDEIRAARPELAESLVRIGAAWSGPARGNVLAQEYDAIRPISIDYAVLERSGHVVVMEAAFQWDDVGSWRAIERLSGRDDAGNTIRGQHVGLDTRGCVVLADAGQLVASLGVEDLIIVHSGNATLVAKKDQEESIKQLVDLIRQQGHEQFL